MRCCFCPEPTSGEEPQDNGNAMLSRLFPPRGMEDATAQEVSAEVAQMVSALVDYLCLHPSELAQVSCSISSRTQDALEKQQHGTVKIAARVYICLLQSVQLQSVLLQSVQLQSVQLQSEQLQSVQLHAAYPASAFSRELIQAPENLMQAIMNNSNIGVQIAGAEVLAVFIHLQRGEHMVDGRALDLLVAQAMRIGAHSPPTLKEAQEPHEAVEQLQIAILRVVQEYALLCQRKTEMPSLLEEMTSFVLGCITADEMLQSDQRADDTNITSAARLAHQTFQQFQPFLQDVDSVTRVLETLLSYLDAGSHWEQAPFMESLILMLMELWGGQSFPLYMALMCHSHAPSLSTPQRKAVFDMATRQDVKYSLSGIGVCLKQLPHTLALVGPGPESSDLRNLILSETRKMAGQVEDAQQLLLAIEGLLYWPEREAVAVVDVVEGGVSLSCTLVEESMECCIAALDAMKYFPPENHSLPTRMLPNSLFQKLASAATGQWGGSRIRKLSLDMFRLMLSCIEDGLSNEGQSLQLLNVVFEWAAKTEVTPREYETLGLMMSLAIGSLCPTVLLGTAQLLATLRDECAQVPLGRLGSLGPVQACSVLLVLCATLRCLHDACGDAGAEAVGLLPPKLQSQLEGGGAVRALRLKPRATVRGTAVVGGSDGEHQVQALPLPSTEVQAPGVSSATSSPMVLVAPGVSSATSSPMVLVAVSGAHDLAVDYSAACETILACLSENGLGSPCQWTEAMAMSVSTSTLLQDAFGSMLVQRLQETFTPSPAAACTGVAKVSNCPVQSAPNNGLTTKAQSWSTQQRNRRQEIAKLNKVMDILETGNCSEAEASSGFSNVFSQ